MGEVEDKKEEGEEEGKEEPQGETGNESDPSKKNNNLLATLKKETDIDRETVEPGRGRRSKGSEKLCYISFPLPGKTEKRRRREVVGGGRTGSVSVVAGKQRRGEEEDEKQGLRANVQRHVRTYVYRYDHHLHTLTLPAKDTRRKRKEGVEEEYEKKEKNSF